MARILEGRPRLQWSLIALGLYTFATLVVLYPAPFHLGTRIIGEEYRDAYQYAWFLWWGKQAVLDPDKSLARLSLMDHPIGTDHPFLLSMVGMTLASLPFSFVFSPATTYNLQVLLALILSGLTMFLLCMDLTGDPRAALVGGLIFAFFPNKMGHVLGGHLPQITMYWFPLYVLFLRRTIKEPSWKTALPTAAVLVPASLIHVMHLAYFVLPLTVTVLAIGWAELKRAFFTPRRMGWLLAAFFGAFLVVLPFLLPTLRLSLEEDTYLLESGTLEHSTDLLAFLTPSPYHPVLGPAGWLPPFADEVFPNRRSLREGLAYPGLLVAGLALWGAVRRRREGRAWGTLALVMALLSLGPLLRAGRELVIYQVDTNQGYIVMPYALLKAMPMLRIGRTPGRLNGTTMFALSILSAFGTAHLLSRMAGRPRRTFLFLGAVTTGILFEFLTIWPFPTGTAEIPPSVQKIAEEPSEGALLHVPMTRRRVNHRALYYQTFLPRPIVGGITHRVVPETVPWSETIRGLAEPDPAPGDIVPRPDPTQRIAWLRSFDVDYVLFHYLTFEKIPADSDLFYRDFLQTLLGPPKYEDAFVAAFPVPRDIATPDEPFLYTMSRHGWHSPVQDGGLWRRWMDEEGSLYLYSNRQVEGNLQFTVDSHLAFPTLEVYLGDQRLDTFAVGDRITYTTRPFTLTQGMNVFHFYAPDGCPETVDDPLCWADALLSPPLESSQPTCEPEAIRTTCRTFVFDQIRFVPQEEQPPGTWADVNLGDQIRLRGWHVGQRTLQPGDTLTVTLIWEASVPLDERYVAFLHLLSPDGTLVAQDDTPLVGQRLPAWPRGISYGYPVPLRLPDDLPPGEYRLLTGAYRWPSLERLLVLADVPGAEIRAVEIGQVQVKP